MSYSIFSASSDWAEGSHLELTALDETSSTNLLAKEHATQEVSAIKLYLTDKQTHGRGRGIHRWESPSSGSALLSSWSFQMLETPQPVLTAALGLGLFKAAKATWLGNSWGLKAPNDLYLDDKKVAGLLIESVSQGDHHRLICGLGMNVFSRPDVAQAGCLSESISDSELGSEIWFCFLDRLLLEWTTALLLSPSGKLHPSTCLGLCTALNSFSKTHNLYKKVHPNGDLQTQQGSLIKWSEL